MYVLFIAINLKSIVEHFSSTIIDLRYYMLMLLLPLLVLSWIQNLKFLIPLSIIGNAIMIVSFTIIFYYIIDATPSFEGKVPVGNIAELPLFVGTVLFALDNIGIVSIYVTLGHL